MAMFRQPQMRIENDCPGGLGGIEYMYILRLGPASDNLSAQKLCYYARHGFN